MKQNCKSHSTKCDMITIVSHGDNIYSLDYDPETISDILFNHMEDEDKAYTRRIYQRGTPTMYMNSLNILVLSSMDTCDVHKNKFKVTDSNIDKFLNIVKNLNDINKITYVNEVIA